MTTYTTLTPAGHQLRSFPVKFLAALVVLLFAFATGPLRAAEEVPGAAAASVNINTADAETLAVALHGVGLARAQDIVRYREQFGPFTTLEQLTEVKGIGAATLEKNRARIKLD